MSIYARRWGLPLFILAVFTLVSSYGVDHLPMAMSEDEVLMLAANGSWKRPTILTATGDDTSKEGGNLTIQFKNRGKGFIPGSRYGLRGS